MGCQLLAKQSGEDFVNEFPFFDENAVDGSGFDVAEDHAIATHFQARETHEFVLEREDVALFVREFGEGRAQAELRSGGQAPQKALYLPGDVDFIHPPGREASS